MPVDCRSRSPRWRRSARSCSCRTVRTRSSCRAAHQVGPHVLMLVRRAGLGDLDELAPLFDGYRQFYGQGSDPAAARAFLAERLRRDESVIFVAIADDVMHGFTQLYPSFSSVS